VDGVLPPQRVTGGVHGGDAQARIDYLETSQVAGEEEIFEVTSNGEEARTEVGLEVFIVTVWGMVLGIAAALQQIPRKGGKKNDFVGLQKAKQRQSILEEHKQAFLAG
jgi:hypothetical protein